MKVLFIGGTGIISTACVQLAIERGIEMVLLNRGQTTSRPIPKEVQLLRGDIRDRESVRAVLTDHSFDVVVDWIAFTPDHIETDLDLFRGRVGQYIFISSASAYQKPPAMLPITESTPLHNPIWKYSQNKIACEDRLTLAYRSENFPVTIVRPSHTYDPSLSPIHGGYTAIDRMRKGKQVIVHGDGTSIWVLTHHTDFAKGFVGLLGNPHTIGDAVQIMSDELLTWNQIYELMAHAAGVDKPQFIHIPSEFIAAFDREWGDSLLGDKAHSVIFDNSKLKRLVPGFIASVPFVVGAQEIIDWFDADPSRQKIDRELDITLDRIIAAYESGWPK